MSTMRREDYDETAFCAKKRSQASRSSSSALSRATAEFLSRSPPSFPTVASQAKNQLRPTVLPVDRCRTAEIERVTFEFWLKYSNLENKTFTHEYSAQPHKSWGRVNDQLPTRLTSAYAWASTPCCATIARAVTLRPLLTIRTSSIIPVSSIDMYNNDVSQKSAQKFMK